MKRKSRKAASPKNRTRLVTLDDIVIDGGTQARAAIDEAVVNEYAERMHAGDCFPPVVLYHDGNRHYAADGFHRILAARQLGLDKILAVLHDGTRQAALWFALGANRLNGTRLNATDKRHAILLALKEWPQKSGNQIAEQIGCNQSTVQRVRDEVMQTHNLPDRVTGKDGKSYPATHHTTPRTVSPRESVHEVAVHADSPPPSPPTHRPLGPPQDGMMYARIAVMKLEEIRDDDLQRADAFAFVRRWLDARES